MNFLDRGQARAAAALVRRGCRSHSRSRSTWTVRRRAGGGAPTRCTPCSTPEPTRPPASRASRTASAAPTTSSPCRCSAPPSGTGSATSSTTARHGTAGRPTRSSPASATRSPASRPSPTSSPAAGCCSTSAAPSGRRRTAGRIRDHRGAPRATIAAQGRSAVGRGDIVLVRTGQLARARRDGWGDYAGGAAPGLSFTTADWLHGTEIAAIATDTWGFEVRPNEFDDAFQPLHQVAIPHIGLFLGEMWGSGRAGRGLRRRRGVRLLADRRAAAGHRRGRITPSTRSPSSDGAHPAGG